MPDKPAARVLDPTAHGGCIIVGDASVLIGDMPAAREADLHVCPMADPSPHVGGHITRGAQQVLIGDQPAARVGDLCACRSVGVSGVGVPGMLVFAPRVKWSPSKSRKPSDRAHIKGALRSARWSRAIDLGVLTLVGDAEAEAGAHDLGGDDGRGGNFAVAAGKALAKLKICPGNDVHNPLLGIGVDGEVGSARVANDLVVGSDGRYTGLHGAFGGEVKAFQVGPNVTVDAGLLYPPLLALHGSEFLADAFPDHVQPVDSRIDGAAHVGAGWGLMVDPDASWDSELQRLHVKLDLGLFLGVGAGMKLDMHIGAKDGGLADDAMQRGLDREKYGDLGAVIQRGVAAGTPSAPAPAPKRAAGAIPNKVAFGHPDVLIGDE